MTAPILPPPDASGADARALDAVEDVDALGARAAALLAPAPTRVMGILNVTPDSFSDGGRWAAHDAAVAHGLAMAARGAQIVDVGGESTRPGSVRVTPDDEQARILPVVAALAAEGIAVSVDTLHAATARAAVEAGAVIVNDVSGGLHDPAMLATVADLGAIYVAQHWRGTPETMTSLAHYDDVVGEVCDELAARRDAALGAGIRADRLVLDPGLGFAKDADHNWAVLAHLGRFAALGFPLLLGASRKRFLADIPVRAAAAGPSARDDAAGPSARDDAAGPSARDDATTAITVLCAQQRIWGVRVHEVGGSLDAVRVVEAVRAGGAR